jgi:hypothetical protein
MADQPANPKPKLRWYQFSLRTLLIFVTLFAIPCSWLAEKMQQARRQKEAVESLLKNGGSVRYDYEFNSTGKRINGARQPGPAWMRQVVGDDFFRNVAEISFVGESEVTNEDLEHLEGLNQLKTLWFNETKITDAKLKHITVLNQLQDLGLGQTNITDAGLECLIGLKTLQSINLSDTQITDTGLERVNVMKQLKYLGLGGTKITDAGLKHLAGLSQLEVIALDGTKITDAGLEHLKGMTQLQCLYLRETEEVTEVGVRKLKKALPNLQIVR